MTRTGGVSSIWHVYLHGWMAIQMRKWVALMELQPPITTNHASINKRASDECIFDRRYQNT